MSEGQATGCAGKHAQVDHADGSEGLSEDALSNVLPHSYSATGRGTRHSRLDNFICHPLAVEEEE